MIRPEIALVVLLILSASSLLFIGLVVFIFWTIGDSFSKSIDPRYDRFGNKQQ